MEEVSVAKTDMVINLNEYRELVNSSKGLNRDLKELNNQLNIMGKVPIILGEYLVMVNLNNGKTEKIKDRKSKALAGVFINGLIRTNKDGDKESLKKLVNWDAPEVVFSNK